MFGLTTLGVIHTIISLLAVGAGAMALFRDGSITWANTIGKFYVITTIIVCLTGFGIFQHGGFGKAHALGIITLLVLGLIYLTTTRNTLFGKANEVVTMVCYTLTFFFHIIPGVTETATRLPLAAPLASSPEDPGIQKVIGVCFVLFVLGAAVQVRRLQKSK
jgi:hypothetical protein